MNVRTTKDAVNAVAILLSVSASDFAQRSATALAQEAGVTENEAVRIARSLGLVEKRRRSDGVVLFGIAGRVNGNDVQHVPVALTSVAAASRHAAACSHHGLSESQYNAAKEAVRVALNDRRYTTRSLSRLKELGNVNAEQLEDVLDDLGAEVNGEYAGLRSRR